MIKKFIQQNLRFFETAVICKQDLIYISKTNQKFMINYSQASQKKQSRLELQTAIRNWENLFV